MTKTDIIENLGLELHPSEGGYFRRTYESGLSLQTAVGSRRLLTSIYYLLTDDSPIGYLHKNCSDIIHFYHCGAPIRYFIISPDGEFEESVLGPDVANNQRPQLLVKGGFWKASQLYAGEYGLISEAVAPGFEYEDNEIASLSLISQLFPELVSLLRQYIKC